MAFCKQMQPTQRDLCSIPLMPQAERRIDWQRDGTQTILRKIRAAVALRREMLRLDEVTDAWRVVHSEGDGLSGLVVDRYGDLLVVGAQRTHGDGAGVDDLDGPQGDGLAAAVGGVQVDLRHRREADQRVDLGPHPGQGLRDAVLQVAGELRHPLLEAPARPLDLGPDLAEVGL